MSFPARTAFALAGLLALAPSASEADLQKLEKIRKEIEESEVRAKEFRAEAQGLLGELEGIDRELSTTRRSVFELRRRGRSAETELRELRDRVAESERRLATMQAALESRLVALYRWSSVRGLPAVASAEKGETLFTIFTDGAVKLIMEMRDWDGHGWD